MIDTHCHVHDRAFDADRDEVIARAREAGVRAMITIGENLDDSRTAVDAAQRYGICAAVGIHPHEAAKAPSDIEARLKPLLARAGVVALGEIGLDYYYDRSPRDVQTDVFTQQLRIGRECRGTDRLSSARCLRRFHRGPTPRVASRDARRRALLYRNSRPGTHLR